MAEHVAGRGALGAFFATQLGGTIKMGDSPSVGYLLHGTPEDPSQPGWGGRFVRVWDGRKAVFDRLTTEADRVEVFGVVEFALPVPEGFSADHAARMIFDGRVTVAGAIEGDRLRFRFSPRDAKVWSYAIAATSPASTGSRAGSRPCRRRSSARADRRRRIRTGGPTTPTRRRPRASMPAQGRVNRWRVDFLGDFAARMQRCKAPKPLKEVNR